MVERRNAQKLNLISIKYLPVCKMNRELPEDVLGLIKDYAKPIWTRPDWRFCGYRESSLIMRYYEWQPLLYYDVVWFRMTDIGWVMLGGEEIVKWIQDAHVIQKLIDFERGYYLHLVDMRDILRDWMLLNWRYGILAAPHYENP